MPTKNEKRELSFTNLRIRSADNTDGRTVEGIAVPFGEIIDVWGDKETFSLCPGFKSLWPYRVMSHDIVALTMS
ncbi:hypothetical protein HMPREF3214_01656 [Alloscardovia omnicolens]|nr:hypothetical protein HMPREF3214_01656 [Alloscardovia omnicolens]